MCYISTLHFILFCVHICKERLIHNTVSYNNPFLKHMETCIPAHEQMIDVKNRNICYNSFSNLRILFIP